MELTSQTELQQGKYKIIRVLGQGGFGITYLAENTLFDQLVAIKEFFPKDFCDRDNTNHVTIGTQNNADTVEKLKARFLKEAKNIAKLDHPGIVRIHDVFKENETAYFVMEYIEGESLSEIIKRNGPLDEDVALEYIRQVGEALNYIHSRNMTHYDVKPANIMVRKSDNKPILIDFGLSKQYDAHGDATSTLMQGISQGFSPIELYAGGNITSFSPQTDIYSLGATLYYLIEGVIPPNAPDLYENGLEFHKCESASIKDAIQSAMSISKAKRPANIELFLNLLGSAETISSNSDADEDIIDEPSDVNRDLLSGQDENTLLVNDQAKSDIAEASNDIEESDDNSSISNEDESEQAKYKYEIEHLHNEVNFYKDKYHEGLKEAESVNDSIDKVSSKNSTLKGWIYFIALIALTCLTITFVQCSNISSKDQEIFDLNDTIVILKNHVEIKDLAMARIAKFHPLIIDSISVHDQDNNQRIVSKNTSYISSRISIIRVSKDANVLQIKFKTPYGLSTGKTSHDGYSYSDTIYEYSGESRIWHEVTGWGGDDKGHWLPGKYSLEYYVDGKFIAKKDFTVY